MKNYNGKKKVEILDSVIISFVLLMIFFLLRISPCKDMLDIEPLWVLVAFIPLIITIIFSGIIKGFKGLGIELEFSKTIEELNLNIPLDTIKVSKGSCSLKGNQEDLKALLEEGKLEKIKVIQFILSKKGYYDSKLVSVYFESFINLEYIEIINEKKEFQGFFYFQRIFNEYSYCKDLAKIKKCIESLGNSCEDKDLKEIEKFIESVEKNTLKETYGSEYIVEYVKKDNTLIEAYIKFDDLCDCENKKVLPLLECHKMIGLVSRCQINEQIAKKAIQKIAK